MPGTISFLRQSFPGKPTFTEKDVPDLKDKVIIVTGSNTGLGKELAQILYSKNATVYMMARSQDKTQGAITSIKAAFPKSTGKLVFIRLDLADLTSIKASAEEFLRKEDRLDILFNNAGVGYPEKGSKSNQGYELQLGVNCIGTFALTKCLIPTLTSTAKQSQPNTVRVVWVSSSAAEAINPQNFMEDLGEVEKKGSFEQYCMSKLGEYFLATEFAARYKIDGVLSYPLNPGNLDSDFWRTQGALTTCVLRKTLLYPPICGAYTALFTGLSPELNVKNTGSFVAPWGRFWELSKDMVAASRSEVDGGAGTAAKFWEWTEAQTGRYGQY